MVAQACLKPCNIVMQACSALSRSGLPVQGTAAASLVDKEGEVAGLESASSAGRAGTGLAAAQALVAAAADSGSIEMDHHHFTSASPTHTVHSQ